MSTSPTPAKKPQPVLIVMSIMAALTMAVGGLAAIQEVPRLVVTCAALAVTSVNVGMAYYLRGLVVPLVDVGTYVDADRQMVDGPAAGEQYQPEH